MNTLKSLSRRSALSALAAGFGAVLTFPGVALGQSWPSRPLHMIIPFPPGGSTDALARLLAKEIGPALGQPVISDNKGGAGGDIGSAIVARSPADGYTMLLVSSGFVVNPSLRPVQYDPIKDFAPITYLATVPSLLVVNPHVKAQNIGELVKLIKQSPAGTFNFASTGVGSVQHLAGELFKRDAGVDITHVPYNGAGPALQAVIAGQVQMLVASVPALKAYIENGQLRAMATTMPQRVSILPQVPTFVESGFPTVIAEQLQGLLVPSGTPPEVVQRLNKVVVDALRQPAVAKQLADMGFIVVGDSPEEFATKIRSQVDSWGKLIVSANIKAD